MEIFQIFNFSSGFGDIIIHVADDGGDDCNDNDNYESIDGNDSHGNKHNNNLHLNKISDNSLAVRDYSYKEHNGMFTLSDTENDLCSETDEMTKSRKWHEWQDLSAVQSVLHITVGPNNYHCQSRSRYRSQCRPV